MSLQRIYLFLLLAVFLSDGTALSAAFPKVGPTRTVGDFKVLHGETDINASTESVWAILTNYNNFKNMLPGYTHSAIISTHGFEKTVDLGLKINLFTPELRYQVHVQEDKNRYIINIERVSGDFDALIAAYKLVPINKNVQYTHVIYDLKIDFGIPVPGVGLLMHSNMEADLSAIQAYCERHPQHPLVDAKKTL